MSWKIDILPEAKRDLAKLDGSQKIEVRKAVRKVANNPLPANEGGYGKPLGNKGERNLSGLFKIKLRASGLRAVHSLARKDERMVIVVVGVREDNEVYEVAESRLRAYSELN